MKGIWNRLRLALLGGILAFAGAGIVSPLAGGVVAEAAGAEETITLVGINNTSSGDTYAQKTDGTWNTEYVYGSVLNGSGNPDSYDKNAYIGNFGDTYACNSRLHYYASITFIDEQIGRVIDALKRKGMYDNSLIIFLSLLREVRSPV